MKIMIFPDFPTLRRTFWANFIGSQEVQKMNMKMEIRKRKMVMIQKETFGEKLFYGSRK